MPTWCESESSRTAGQVLTGRTCGLLEVNRHSQSLSSIGVLFVCFGRRIDGPGLPGGLIIHQGHLISPKRTHVVISPSESFR